MNLSKINKNNDKQRGGKGRWGQEGLLLGVRLRVFVLVPHHLLADGLEWVFIVSFVVVTTTGDHCWRRGLGVAWNIHCCSERNSRRRVVCGRDKA